MSNELSPDLRQDIESFNEFKAMAGFRADADEVDALITACLKQVGQGDQPVNEVYRQAYDRLVERVTNFWFHPVDFEVLETATQHEIWREGKAARGTPIKRTLTTMVNPFITEFLVDDSGLSMDQVESTLIDLHITNPRGIPFADLLDGACNAEDARSTLSRWWDVLSRQGITSDYIVNVLTGDQRPDPPGTMKAGHLAMVLFRFDTEEEAKLKKATHDLSQLAVTAGNDEHLDLLVEITAAHSRRTLLSEILAAIETGDLHSLPPGLGR